MEEPIYTMYCQHLGEQLELPQDIIDQAKGLTTYCMSRGTLSGRLERTIVGTGIYITANVNHINISQRVIAEKLGVNRMSLSNAWKILRKDNNVMNYIKEQRRPLYATPTPTIPQ